ncbi:MAG: hypothetical protein GY832_36955, partial [Chloroflexi bacterium]|nr:hypothetical protein [Chloroflexota bacterium]
LLATAETEGRYLRLPRFSPVQRPENEPRATDCHKNRLDLPIASTADATLVRSLAVSPWFAQVVRWLVSLAWAGGDGMRGEELAVGG